MPELPEVETVVRGLRNSILGAQIDEVFLSNKKMRIMPGDDFLCNVMHQYITDVQRRAKYILIHLSNSYIIVIHLGMSGKVIVSHNIKDSAHNHAIFELSNGFVMTFNDPRRFGLITTVLADDLHKHVLFKNLGIEPLTDEFTSVALKAMVSGRSTNIKTLIMDGNLVVGVGNIYASESLFRSKIHPLTSGQKLSDKQIEILTNNIKDILLESIESGGSTFRDYVRSSGDSGYFQHSFAVYGRNGLACVTCDSEIEKIIIAQRSTFFCGNCQKK